MSYEVWVMVLLLLNTALGVVAVWQRHQTIRKLKADNLFPRVHQPRTREFPTDYKVLDDFFGGPDATRKSDRQDEGASKVSRPNISFNDY